MNQLFMPVLSYQIYPPVPLGSNSELPAESCREIKNGEGQDAISNKYWLDPTRSGRATLVYCDMKIEGFSSQFVRCI